MIEGICHDDSFADQTISLVQPKESEQHALRRVDGGFGIKDKHALAIALRAPRCFMLRLA